MNPDGRVDNCCVSRNNLGNINQETLEDVIFGSRNREIKKNLLDGHLPPGCSACATPGPALRQEFIKWFADKEEASYPPTKEFSLRYADLRWRNTCNFACVYCGPELSSTWAQETNQYPKILQDGKTDLLQFLLDNLNTLDYLYLAGGEPLLLKENELVLNKLLQVNPNCEIRINTNLSTLDNNVWAAVKQFKNIFLIISLDAVGEYFDYIRYGGDWKTFADNLKIARQVTNRMTFNLVYNALNTEKIYDCIDYLIGEGFDPESFSVLFYNLGKGGPLDPRNLSLAQRNKAEILLKNRISQSIEGRFKENLTKVLNLLQLPYNNDGFSSLHEFVAEIDKRRKLDSRILFPEIYE